MSTLDLDRRLAEIATRPRTRRGVLAGAGSLALAAALSRLPLDLAYGSSGHHGADPFTLGVASGDPAPRGVVLWTRLAPAPLQADGGMPPRPVEVRWELAHDASMRRLVDRTRTAPTRHVSKLDFAFVTCQKWEEGFYPAYRAIAREDVDFVAHLGDYTYEYGIENGAGPRNPQLPSVRRCWSGARMPTARSTSTCRCAASRSRTARTCRSTGA